MTVANSNKITALKALALFFNSGENKKPLREFADEVKALSDDEKQELGQLSAEALGMELITAVPSLAA